MTFSSGWVYLTTDCRLLSVKMITDFYVNKDQIKNTICMIHYADLILERVLQWQKSTFELVMLWLAVSSSLPRITLPDITNWKCCKHFLFRVKYRSLITAPHKQFHRTPLFIYSFKAGHFTASSVISSSTVNIGLLVHTFLKLHLSKWRLIRFYLNGGNTSWADCVWRNRLLGCKNVLNLLFF